MLGTTVVCLVFSSFLAQQVDTQYINYDEIGDNGNSSLVHPASLSCPGVWSIFENNKNNGSISCSCGNDFKRVLLCDKKTLQVKLLPCFCVTPYAKNPNITVVGACVYKCHLPINNHHNIFSGSASELSMYFCNSVTAAINGTWNRVGQLCGKCKQGFVPRAYSYDWRCVRCSYDEYSVVNLVKYCVIAFLPLTIFFIVLVTLRISATSPSMNAFILVCQILSSPLQIRLFLTTISSDVGNHVAVKAFEVIASLLGFWNLDFFRALYSPFCLHPNMSTLQVLALDYIIAAYPLLLIVITYFLVELHDRNCRIIVWLWKPFRRCFIRIGRMFVRTSLVEAFASFLLLSC